MLSAVYSLSESKAGDTQDVGDSGERDTGVGGKTDNLKSRSSRKAIIVSIIGTFQQLSYSARLPNRFQFHCLVYIPLSRNLTSRLAMLSCANNGK